MCYVDVDRGYVSHPLPSLACARVVHSVKDWSAFELYCNWSRVRCGSNLNESRVGMNVMEQFLCISGRREHYQLRTVFYKSDRMSSSV